MSDFSPILVLQIKICINPDRYGKGNNKLRETHPFWRNTFIINGAIWLHALISNRLNHKITTADISVDWGSATSRAAFSGYNSHVAKVCINSLITKFSEKNAEKSNIQRICSRNKAELTLTSLTRKRIDWHEKDRRALRLLHFCILCFVYASFCEKLCFVLKIRNILFCG